jgi:hypothetical protein
VIETLHVQVLSYHDQSAPPSSGIASGASFATSSGTGSTDSPQAPAW